MRQPALASATESGVRPPAALERQTSAAAAKAGIDYLLSKRRGRHWADFGAEPLGTAYVVARLGVLPPDFIDRSLQQVIEESLDWLVEARTPEGGWGSAGGDDAETTSWALIALRRSGRSTPASAAKLLLRCRRRDGGFALNPAGGPGDPEATALAVQALGSLDQAAETFLLARLQSDGSRLASPLGVCLAILEWEKGCALRH